MRLSDALAVTPLHAVRAAVRVGVVALTAVTSACSSTTGLNTMQDGARSFLAHGLDAGACTASMLGNVSGAVVDIGGGTYAAVDGTGRLVFGTAASFMDGVSGKPQQRASTERNAAREEGTFMLLKRHGAGLIAEILDGGGNFFCTFGNVAGGVGAVFEIPKGASQAAAAAFTAAAGGIRPNPR